MKYISNLSNVNKRKLHFDTSYVDSLKELQLPYYIDDNYHGLFKENCNNSSYTIKMICDSIPDYFVIRLLNEDLTEGHKVLIGLGDHDTEILPIEAVFTSGINPDLEQKCLEEKISFR